MNSHDSSSADDARLRELTDALRPGSDDLSRPEFAALAERCQRDPQWARDCARAARLDRAVSDVMHDLPVPAGAVDRLLAHLQSAAAAPTSLSRAKTVLIDTVIAGEIRDESDASAIANGSAALSELDRAKDSPAADGDAAHRASTGDPSVDQSSSQRPRPRLFRSFDPLSIASAVALASFLLAGIYFVTPVEKYGPEEMLNVALDFAESHDPAQKFRIADKPPPADYPPSTAVVVRATEWWPIDGLMGRQGVAYSLRAAGTEATLYVVRHKGSWRSSQLVDLEALPPKVLQTTHGYTMAAWAPQQGPEEGLVYLLVVKGDPQQYRAFVSSSGPLAWLDSTR